MKSALLVVATVILSLALFEVGLRVFTSYGSNAANEVPVGSDKPVDLAGVIHYVEQLPLAPGTSREWFTEDPPPLPNRTAPSEDRQAHFRQYQQRGLFGPQADYIWNRRFVETNFCSPDTFFQNYPEKILVFDPPAGNPHPRYRFPPNTTLASGLVTNQYGLRGHLITLAKPPKTIRIAFVGASTTVNDHSAPFSYPEYVENWLNRFAAANRLDVHFEALNSGREGLNSEDLTAIVHDELLALNPDLAVYYEGSNQFPFAHSMLSPPIKARPQIDPRDRLSRHKVPALIRTHFAVGDLADRAVNGFSAAGEPRKPFYRLIWPPGVDQHNPNVDNPNLPLQLPVIIKNLDSIREDMRSIGGQLVLCSFEWFANDGMPLLATRHANIYNQLNTVLWPLRYSDIRRLADFQNVVFQRYAAARSIPFLDVARALPQDPNLFNDAIHLTNTGERLKAWIVFQQLAPVIRREIESGRLPRPTNSGHVPAPPSEATSEMPLRCGDAPPGTLTRIDGNLSLDTIQLIPGKGSLQRGHPMKVTTPPERWAYAASFPLHVPANLNGAAYLLVRARVVSGQIGLGVLDHSNNSFQVEKNVNPSPGLTDTYVPVFNPVQANELIVRNTAGGDLRSQILIEDVALVLAPKP